MVSSKAAVGDADASPTPTPWYQRVRVLYSESPEQCGYLLKLLSMLEAQQWSSQTPVESPVSCQTERLIMRGHCALSSHISDIFSPASLLVELRVHMHSTLRTPSSLRRPNVDIRWGGKHQCLVSIARLEPEVAGDGHGQHFMLCGRHGRLHAYDDVYSRS